MLKEFKTISVKNTEKKRKNCQGCLDLWIFIGLNSKRQQKKVLQCRGKPTESNLHSCHVIVFCTPDSQQVTKGVTVHDSSPAHPFGDPLSIECIRKPSGYKDVMFTLFFPE